MFINQNTVEIESYNYINIQDFVTKEGNILKIIHPFSNNRTKVKKSYNNFSDVFDRSTQHNIMMAFTY
jgi:hypothetical protein